MKKILGTIVLILFLIENAYALSQQEAIDLYLKDRKLDPIEGIWVTGDGMMQATFKENKEYICLVIQSHSTKSGKKFCSVTGEGNTYVGTMLSAQQNRLDTTIVIFGNLRTDYLTGPNGNLTGNLRRLWPIDIKLHNYNYATEEDILNQENIFKQEIARAKKTCGILGFKAGSQEFTDCAFKLYTQKKKISPPE